MAMSADLRGRTLLATGYHAPKAGSGVEVLRDVLVSVDAEGTIDGVLRSGEDGHAAAREAARRDGRLSVLPEGTVLMPGLVDLHVHAPQYPQLGRALDAPLEVWLQRYTFPLEARYADLAFARRVYRRLVADLLANGTTTAVYFATIDVAASCLLADICVEQGQRALVGKVAMDNPKTCPENYRDASAQAAVEGTRALIEHVRGHPQNRSGRVQPMVTPRFIPACTDAALEQLGGLARECGCRVQTHCSESDWEHAHVAERHGMSDAASLDRFGLLGEASVLAHGNFLSPDDMDLIRARRAAVAHCPASNAYFAGAVFPLRAALEKGVRVGLGTDISGGPIASVFEAMRAAAMVSRMLESGVDPGLGAASRGGRAGARVSMAEAFHLATAGGADALGLPVGRFEPGCHFDAIAIDTTAEKGTVRLWGEEPGEAMLEAILHTASKPNIASVWVGGVAVA